MDLLDSYKEMIKPKETSKVRQRDDMSLYYIGKDGQEHTIGTTLTCIPTFDCSIDEQEPIPWAKLITIRGKY